MGWGWHGWYMGWMGIFWIILIILIVWVIMRPHGTSLPPQHRESPEEILKRRYANGEISREDYERMLHDVRR